MSKPRPNSLVPKNDNIKKLLDALDVCKPICSISYKALEDTAYKQQKLEEVDNYYEKNHDKFSDKYQSGKVWFLVKKQNESLEVLQVAQAIDYENKQNKGFFNEIHTHIEEILGDSKDNIYSDFFKEIREEGELIFYELDIENYLSKFAPFNYQEIIYRMAREYFAEASIAHFTQAREWRFYNSGMDKRALYYLYGNIELLEIDKQKDESIQR
ncbi:MAG: hypothetical protein ACLUVC_04355 [Longibaculum sp.]